MKYYKIIAVALLVSLSGCQTVETIKDELKTSSMRLDGSTKKANIIIARLIVDPENVSTKDKADLLQYLKNIRKATIGLNVLVGNYTFEEAISILYFENIITKKDVYGFFSSGRLTKPQYNFIIKGVLQ